MPGTLLIDEEMEKIVDTSLFTPGGEPQLVITRVFDAPRELVFQVWTDPQYVAQWWCPRMFTISHCELDARPGGTIHIDMRGPDGTLYPWTGSFKEVVVPERLVFTSVAMQDAAGNPEFEVEYTATFEDQGDKTRLTLQGVVVKATPAAAGPLAGMEEGWQQSLDKLSELLAEVTSR